jgi:hypothetical protein
VLSSFRLLQVEAEKKELETEQHLKVMTEKEMASLSASSTPQHFLSID